MPADPHAALSARTGVVVPIRAFSGGQARLVGALDAAARAELGRDLATRVVTAAAPLPVVVVSDAPEVRAWADALAVDSVLDDPGSLDAAARAGVDWCRSRGLPRAVVAHADLPWVCSFLGVAHDGTRPIVTIVPCHRDDGSPVLSVPTETEFEFAYGEGSFRRHVAEARRRGLAVRVVRDPTLAFDVDVPADLALLDATLATRR